jgi:hypothetical protein
MQILLFRCLISDSPLRFEIRHRLFARRTIAATVDRPWIVHSSDSPEPRAPFRYLRLKHDAADNGAAAQDNVIIGMVERAAVLAARRFEN